MRYPVTGTVLPVHYSRVRILALALRAPAYKYLRNPHVSEPQRPPIDASSNCIIA
jgi:hypothetical protein